jgi:hypothetical protein
MKQERENLSSSKAVNIEYRTRNVEGREKNFTPFHKALAAKHERRPLHKAGAEKHASL